MKTVLTYLLAGAMVLAIAYGVVSHNKNAQLRLELANAQAQWEREKADLEAALTAARAKAAMPPRVITETVTKSYGTNVYSPQEILEELISLDPKETDETRNQTLRMIIAQFQRLADCDRKALPVIREFLVKNQDVYYTSGDLTATGERARRATPTFNPARTDFLVPPSLRLGLMDVLKRIGGQEAENILAEVLATTGRGVEVAYLARILEQIAPSKYRDAAITAAKELLLNPPPVDSPNRLDDNARAYLYEVLKMYGDTTYVAEAQAKLVTPEGTVDRTTLGYLTMMLKEDALPLIYNAYNDPRLTNVWEKTAVLKQALQYVGGQAQANEMFASAIASEAMPDNLKSFMVLSLSGGHRAATPKEPQIIQGRLELLDYLKRNTTDESILRSIGETQTELQKMLEQKLAERAEPPPEAAPEPDMPN